MTEEHAWVREGERPFLRTVEDWCAQVIAQNRWYLTDFLTPREQYLATSIAWRRGLVIRFHGGYETAERQRALIMPDDWYPESADFDVTCLEVEPLDGAIRHRDLQGSVLGLGLQRKALGDIVVTDVLGYLFATQPVANFIYTELHRVGRSTVSATRLQQLPELPAPVYVDKDITVASLRLDAVVAGACSYSRAKAQDAVLHKEVTLNFTTATQRDEVGVGDLISVRGFGRVKVHEVLGTTRRDRTRLRIGVLHSKA